MENEKLMCQKVKMSITYKEPVSYYISEATFNNNEKAFIHLFLSAE